MIALEALPGRRRPVPKRFRRGTHRGVSPGRTLQTAAPAAVAAGITRVANVTGLDRIGIPVYMTVRPHSRSVSVSQGKGISHEAARASGVMEAIELWHAERITAPLLLRRWADLRGTARVVDVGRLPTVADSRFRPDLPLLWIAGRDLFTGEECWVPYECVSMDATVPAPPGSGCFLSTSNGLASGNDVLEALEHALCEVVERDATALWRVGGAEALRRTLVDWHDCADPELQQAEALCRRAGVRVLAWDLTSDVGVPAFASLISEPETGAAYQRSAAVGYGCHLDPSVALLRAVTEAVQSRLTYISGSRDDLFRDEYEDDVQVRRHLQTCEALLDTRPGRRLQDVADLSGETFDDDVQTLLDRLQAVGVDEAVAVDLTDPRLGVPVVRVIVPGLEGPDTDPDYLPGPRARAEER